MKCEWNRRSTNLIIVINHHHHQVKVQAEFKALHFKCAYRENSEKCHK